MKKVISQERYNCLPFIYVMPKVRLWCVCTFRGRQVSSSELALSVPFTKMKKGSKDLYRWQVQPHRPVRPNHRHSRRTQHQDEKLPHQGAGCGRSVPDRRMYTQFLSPRCGSWLAPLLPIRAFQSVFHSPRQKSLLTIVVRFVSEGFPCQACEFLGVYWLQHNCFRFQVEQELHISG